MFSFVSLSAFVLICLAIFNMSSPEQHSINSVTWKFFFSRKFDGNKDLRIVKLILCWKLEVPTITVHYQHYMLAEWYVQINLYYSSEQPSSLHERIELFKSPLHMQRVNTVEMIFPARDLYSFKCGHLHLLHGDCTQLCQPYWVYNLSSPWKASSRCDVAPWKTEESDFLTSNAIIP